MAEPAVQSFREIVEKIDGPSRHRDSLYPFVYHFSGNKSRRDSGPAGGPYANHYLRWTADSGYITADDTIHTADLGAP